MARVREELMEAKRLLRDKDEQLARAREELGRKDEQLEERGHDSELALAREELGRRTDKLVGQMRSEWEEKGRREVEALCRELQRCEGMLGFGHAGCAAGADGGDCAGEKRAGGGERARRQQQRWRASCERVWRSWRSFGGR